MDRFCYAGFPRPLRPRMDVALLLFLVFLNAVFAMSETALTASRKARLQVMVEAGDSGASHALALHDNPTKWLSVVQIGITSIGLLNGIVGEAAFSTRLATWLRSQIAISDRDLRAQPGGEPGRERRLADDAVQQADRGDADLHDREPLGRVVVQRERMAGARVSRFHHHLQARLAARG